MVRSLDPRAITLLDGALTIEVEANRATVNTLKKVGLDLAALPSEVFHTL